MITGALILECTRMIVVTMLGLARIYFLDSPVATLQIGDLEAKLDKDYEYIGDNYL